MVTPPGRSTRMMMTLYKKESHYSRLSRAAKLLMGAVLLFLVVYRTGKKRVAVIPNNEETW